MYGWNRELLEVNVEQRDDNIDEEDDDSRPSKIEHFSFLLREVDVLGY